MYKNIIKLLVIILFVVTPVQLFGQENCDTLYDLDGMTTASQSFRIENGITCETFAEITWWDYYNNGNEHILKYGTTPSYGNEINLKPFTPQTQITTTIPYLIPNTKYYAQFYRRHNSTERSVEFEFTTSDQSSTIKHVSYKESYLLPLENHFRISGSTLLLSANMKTGDNIVITDLKGKKLFGYTHEVDISKIAMPKLSKGMYLVTQIRNSLVIQTARITLVRSSK